MPVLHLSLPHGSPKLGCRSLVLFGSVLCGEMGTCLFRSYCSRGKRVLSERLATGYHRLPFWQDPEKTLSTNRRAVPLSSVPKHISHNTMPPSPSSGGCVKSMSARAPPRPARPPPPVAAAAAAAAAPPAPPPAAPPHAPPAPPAAPSRCVGWQPPVCVAIGKCVSVRGGA